MINEVLKFWVIIVTLFLALMTFRWSSNGWEGLFKVGLLVLTLIGFVLADKLFFHLI